MNFSFIKKQFLEWWSEDYGVISEVDNALSIFRQLQHYFRGVSAQLTL